MPSILVYTIELNKGNQMEDTQLIHDHESEKPQTLKKSDSYGSFEFKCEVNCNKGTDKDGDPGSSHRTCTRNKSRETPISEDTTSSDQYNLNHETKKNKKLFLKEIKDGRYMRSFSAGPKGGILFLSGMGVGLCIPPNALSVDQDIFIGLSKNGSDIPDGSDGGHLYSPIIICGPHGLQFSKPVYLFFQHSLLLQGEPDRKSLPKLFCSETAVTEESKWEQCETMILLARQVVMTSINSFSKYVMRTIGAAAPCQYRVLRPMIFLEEFNLNDQLQSTKYDNIGIHIYIVDAEDSEKMYAKGSAQGKFLKQDTFYFNENLKSDVSLQVIPGEHYKMVSSEDAKIIEFSEIQDNRIGLENHASFYLKRKKVEGETHLMLQCQIRITQTDGYSRMFDIVAPVYTPVDRDSGIEVQGASGGDSKKRQGIVDYVVPDVNAPSTNLDSVAGAELGIDSEKDLHSFLKPGTVQDFILPPLIRNHLERKMNKEASVKLAKFMDIVEPESWDTSTILYFFDITRQGVDKKMAFQELCSFFQTIEEAELAEICEKFK